MKKLFIAGSVLAFLAVGWSASEVDETKSKEQSQWVKRLTACELLIQRNLKDPDSYRRVGGWMEMRETGIIRYSATNSFGGRLQESFDCR